LSSAILYLAIVAIWAVVLVPRWLRPRAAPPQPVPVPAEPVPAESADADLREPAGPGLDAGADLAAGRDGPDLAAGVAVASIPGEDARDEDVAAEAEVAAPLPAARRAEVLKARRRLLSTLITLTVIAAGLAVTHIDAYWIVIPPTVLLAGYLVLLRQFTHIDAERARRDARTRRAEARTRAGQEPASAATPAVGQSDLDSDAPTAPSGAEIIDISGRISDQVYDQYSDAANRAVGD
jgi:general stress protein CsbA